MDTAIMKWQSWGVNLSGPDSKSYTVNIWTVSLFKLLLHPRMSFHSIFACENPILSSAPQHLAQAPWAVPLWQKQLTLSLSLSFPFHSGSMGVQFPGLFCWKPHRPWGRKYRGAVHIPWEAQDTGRSVQGKVRSGDQLHQHHLFGRHTSGPYPTSLQSESFALGTGIFIFNKYPI